MRLDNGSLAERKGRMAVRERAKGKGKRGRGVPREDIRRPQETNKDALSTLQSHDDAQAWNAISDTRRTLWTDQPGIKLLGPVHT